MWLVDNLFTRKSVNLETGGRLSKRKPSYVFGAFDRQAATNIKDPSRDRGLSSAWERKGKFASTHEAAKKENAFLPGQPRLS